MNFVIREIDVSDALKREALRALIYEAFDDGRLIKNYKPHQTGWWWVAYDDKKQPAAFAGMVPSHQWDRWGYLTLSGVSPPYRGYGLQRRLLRTRMNKARALGWETVCTETIHDNYASQRNLIRTGFLPYAPSKPWGDKHAVYWKRNLTGNSHAL